MSNDQQTLIEKTKTFVRECLAGQEGGHDWWHIVRVHQNALNLLRDSKANRMVVELAALLHDIADAKFHAGDEEKGPLMAEKFLYENGLDAEQTDQVVFIIRNMSFKNSFGFEAEKSIEFQLVEDADRLDALGAIGIARAFSFGGYKLRPFYDPDIPPENFADSMAYKKSKSPTINHFYEKLLLLKDKMNTNRAREMAEERHRFMLQFLEQFFDEWNGNR